MRCVGASSPGEPRGEREHAERREAPCPILELDPEKPVFDKSRFHVDFSVGYRFKLSRDRIRVRTQLNVRNAFEGGRLQAVASDPLGRPTSFRIIDPRLFILTTTLDF